MINLTLKPNTLSNFRRKKYSIFQIYTEQLRYVKIVLLYIPWQVNILMKDYNLIYKLNNGAHLNLQLNKFNKSSKLLHWMIVQSIKQHRRELIPSTHSLIRNQEQSKVQVHLELLKTLKQRLSKYLCPNNK